MASIAKNVNLDRSSDRENTVCVIISFQKIFLSLCKSNFFSIQFVLLKKKLKILWALRKYCKWLRDDQYFFFCVPEKPNTTISTFLNLESPLLLNGSSTQLVTYISSLPWKDECGRYTTKIKNIRGSPKSKSGLCSSQNS